VAHVGKPDVDNLAKLILDQVTRSGNVWRDDSQVVSLTVHKFWAVGTEQGCSVSISTLGI
jgi:Holliday junction resolvase RusA-like endonuclease